VSRGSGRGRRSGGVIAGRAAENFSAAGQGNQARASSVRSVFGAQALHRHFIAHFQIVLAPASADQLNRRARFELPLLHTSVGFHLDIDPGVGIHPFDFGDDTLYSDRLVQIKFRREGVMREGWNSNCAQNGENRKSKFLHITSQPT